MDSLKKALVSAPPLKTLEVTEMQTDGTFSEVGEVIVACDA